MIAELNECWPVLIVEDDLPTSELEARVLLRAGKPSRQTQSVDEAILELGRSPFSAILLDYMLTGENGWGVLTAARALTPQVPVIVVTGRGNEEVAVEALRRGAADYIIKNGKFWEQLPNIVERIVKTAQAEALRKGLGVIAQTSDDAIIGSDSNGKIFNWNKGAQTLFSVDAKGIKGRRIAELFPPERRPVVISALADILSGRRSPNLETVATSDSGIALEVSVAFSPIMDVNGKVEGVSLTARDISERKRAEEQLRRTEFKLHQLKKFDAIREMAGGVAHEFNNMLTVIIMRSELTKSKLGSGNPLSAELDVIIKTGERAASVARQLLAFSGQQFLRPAVLDLNDVVRDILHGVRGIFGSEIVFETRLAANLGKVRVDPVKMDEVIVNLALNARDAMPNGGNILFETANISVDSLSSLAHEGLAPGNYAQLMVSDTGVGMEKECMARIFEPFFTTKGRAERTGLGLSMVYGTIKQSGGGIYASSEVGRGSQFEVLLPRLDLAADKIKSAGIQPVKVPNKTILIVDDTLSVLEIIQLILADAGFTLLIAHSPSEAQAVVRKYLGKIDLLLTDVLMPEMNGPELALRLAVLQPEMKVIYMSGYPEKDLSAYGNPDMDFLAKPFSLDTLKTKVNEVLARK